MPKKLKSLFWLFISFSGISAFFVPKTLKQIVIKDWYDNLSTNKFEIRGQGIAAALSEDNQVVNIPVNNDYELKLLLNPGFETQNEDLITKFNHNFINKVKINDLRYKSFETSEIFPMVWFYFETEKHRESFVNSIKSWNEIEKFIIFENKVNKFEVNRLDPPRELLDPIPYELMSRNFDPTIYKNKNYESFMDLYLQKFIDSSNKNASIVNATNYFNNNYVGKVGILEYWTNNFDRNYEKYFKNGIEINDINAYIKDRKNSHSTIVSLITAGEYGIDRSSKVYLYTSNHRDGHWNKTIQKMIKEDGIRLINHSYGPLMLVNMNGNEIDNPNYFSNYNENAYFLDYVSRKYGVINVFSSGNYGNNNRHLISDYKLSFNSIIVGALENNATKQNLRSNKVANYSNYQLLDEFSNISKPLVVAPAYFYNPVYENNKYSWGTSYAAPVVTGLISNLMKYKSDIRNSNNRVAIVKAILSASAVSPKLTGLSYKTSGYEQKFGAGTPDFKTMLEAANNYQVKTISPTEASQIILRSDELKLRKGQTIKISSSWMFNAGILKVNPMLSYYSLQNNSYWENKLNRFSWSISSESRQSVDGLDYFNPKTHKEDLWLKQEEAKKRQNDRWFTDYDLILQKKDENGAWITVKGVYTILTNDELIEHKITESGSYRYIVTKVSKNSFANSVDDIVALTHVVRNEDY
ncbi:S8 family serine peptidase [Mycoplasmopsis bovirhinis]|uniref:Subtilase family n=1 Tax=Mycoplasmopsis bovirhinis TaxID=29553 RepID=A0A449ADK9_9BACT|nr:S8 family serine peptidase [Mycoplasmopsis bovirhinis]VEU63063.1 Subtilase family [Mycoplasmopsis bovirhinis]